VQEQEPFWAEGVVDLEQLYEVSWLVAWALHHCYEYPPDLSE
jgi:hypothetical protein